MGETRKRGTRADFKPGWEFGTLPEAEVLRRGGDLFDDRMFWEAHEVWEEVWRRRRGQPDRDFLKGIIQGAAGMWHATQGNYVGAVSVMSRAVDYLAPYHPTRECIDVTALSAALQRAIEACRLAQETGDKPDLTMIQLRLGQEGARA
jgi:predicted metal-dependent hydrolase